MGYEALPFIKKYFSGSEDDAFFPILGWADAVREIVGENFQIPKEIRGNVSKIRDYSVEWLDTNIEKYIN